MVAGIAKTSVGLNPLHNEVTPSYLVIFTKASCNHDGGVLLRHTATQQLTNVPLNCPGLLIQLFRCPSQSQ